MRKILSLALVFLLIIGVFVGCQKKSEEPVVEPEKPVNEEPVEEPAAEPKGEIILSTTTSTQDSGLLDVLLPEFTKDTGYTVKPIAVGTGKALQMGRDAEADVLLVHAKADELKFVEEKFGTERREVMYNDFVLVGPKDSSELDKTNDITSAFKTIAEKMLTFVSRGDDSGTHKKELSLWKEAGAVNEGDWYIEAGAGMGDVLKMADEKLAYTLTDRATYLSMKDNLDLEVFVEGDERLFNQYGVIPVNPELSDKINHEGAKAFADWITSDKGQDLIREYGVDKYGEPLFVPNYKKQLEV